MRRGGQTYYYIVDGLGSVTELTNAAGTVQNAYLYDAWGQTRSQTGSLGNPFVYTAREAGEAATLFYRARYYQPSIGRFLQEDPFSQLLTGTPVSLDTYSYALLEPLDRRDPLGLFAINSKPTPIPFPIIPKPGPMFYEPEPRPSPAPGPNPTLCIQCSVGGLLGCLLPKSPSTGLACTVCLYTVIANPIAVPANAGCWACAANIAIKLPDCVYQQCDIPKPDCGGRCPYPLVP